MFFVFFVLIPIVFMFIVIIQLSFPSFLLVSFHIIESIQQISKIPNLAHSGYEGYSTEFLKNLLFPNYSTIITVRHMCIK